MPKHDLILKYPLIDELLEARRNLFPQQGGVYEGYRNHTLRMLNFARQWTDPSPGREDKLAICGVFHDIDAFPDGNIDYLVTSADKANEYLDSIGRGAWKPEMRLMIEWHHKITAYKGEHEAWVEPIRRADWCDVSFQMLRHGLPKTFIEEINAALPLGAFYPKFVYTVIGKWAITHPLNPVPIMRW